MVISLLGACTQGSDSLMGPGGSLEGSSVFGIAGQGAAPAERPPVAVAGEQIPREFFDAYCKEAGQDENGEPIYECDFGPNPDEEVIQLIQDFPVLRRRLRRVNIDQFIPIILDLNLSEEDEANHREPEARETQEEL